MNRLEIRAFADEHLDAAGSLLAARHREHRAAEPLLSERFERPDATREEVASLWAEKHASGAVALREGQVVGFLLGTRKDDRTRGANVWVEAAGYAADEPELVRDLYAFSSQRWVDEGRTRHYALVPRLDEHVAAWFRLSFGAQQAHGIKAVDLREWPQGTRRAEPFDLEALIELAPLISDHQALAPVFSGIDQDDEDGDELRGCSPPRSQTTSLVSSSTKAAGTLSRASNSLPPRWHQHTAVLHSPTTQRALHWAASLPTVRGSGAGLALTDAAHAWAREQGYATIVTDWRETNLLASRFWPARGFRRSFLRLYRSIP